MTLLNEADVVYLGSEVADAVYLGDELVWSGEFDPANLAGCVLALNAVDVAPGPVTLWPDRSPEHNDLIVNIGAPVAEDGFVRTTTANVLQTTNSLAAGVLGNNPRHLLMLMRSRNVNGAFMGWGAASGAALFDLWNYTAAGTLIWHGHGGGYDTVTGAPPFTPDEWHLVEVTHSGSNIYVSVDDYPPAGGGINGLNTYPNPLLLGVGRYNGAGDFDTAGLFLYDRILTADERDDVRQYLTGLNPSPPWTPTMLSGLTVWLDATQITGVSDGTPVATWSDSSGYGFHAAQASTPVPVYHTDGINGLPAVHFGGLGLTQMTVTPNRLIGERTIFQVLKTVGQSFGNFHTTQLQHDLPHMQTYGSTTIHTYGEVDIDSTVPWSGQCQYITHWCKSDPAQQWIEVDGIQRTAGWVSKASTSPISIGGWVPGSYGSNAYIGEMIIYERCLTTTERQDVQRYLQEKWSP